MNRAASLPLLLLLAAALPAPAEKVATLPKPTGYIDDYANVISTSARSELEGICNEVHDKTKAQVFLVTVKTTEGEEAQTFANELFAKWEIGEKKTDRGVLLLLAINDHKRWIEVGYGFEGILNDAKVGDIGRAMVPDLQASRYDAAARLGILDVSQIIAQDAHVTLNESSADTVSFASTDSQPASAQPLIKNGSPWIPVLLVPLFLGPFIGFFVLAWYTRRRRITSGAGSASSSSGFSSSSSDDSFSSSSDSSSFDGGDGGSSGGGGAGGGW
jgi:uncharacterized protein